jgi:hypothetical protein
VKELREREGVEDVYDTTPYPAPKQQNNGGGGGGEGGSESPYPPVEIWSPPKGKWYQKQIVGKTFGM